MDTAIEMKHYIIDFDSTFTKVEALDVLGEIALADNPNKVAIIEEIKHITDLGMEGVLDLRASLEQRVKILRASKKHLTPLIEALKKEVSKSFTRNRAFLEENADNIYIISNGFKDFITPIVAEYGIAESNVFANSFEYDNHGNIVSFDKSNVLSSNNGKVKTIEKLALQGEVFVIGDGYTDYEIKGAGLANKFYAFTENIERQKVVEKADHVTPSLDEFLYVNKMNKAISYPKNRIKVLLLENVHQTAFELLKEEGYQVEVYHGGMDEEELCKKIKEVSILGIRSKTQVTKKVLESAERLIAIGAFCIGTNQIDLDTCLERGIAVFNAPYSNTRSVVELAISEMILLLRNLPDKIARMHQGIWDKSATGSFEIRGKKIGIVGYGSIGSQLSVLAEAIGLKVYYYDAMEKLALGNAKKCKTLTELLSKVDIVSLHVDGRPENKDLIGEAEFALMKDGVIFINLSRGHVVDIAALKRNIETGKIGGASVDVFPYEPKTNQEAFTSELRGLRNTILTPHIGGSTLEAQINIAEFVPNKIMDYINTGSTTNSVTFPNLQLPPQAEAHRLIHVHQNQPGVLARINQVLFENNINILGQYLKTNETIGYVITDIDKAYDKNIISALKAVEGTLKFRVLY